MLKFNISYVQYSKIIRTNAPFRGTVIWIETIQHKNRGNYENNWRIFTFTFRRSFSHLISFCSSYTSFCML